MVNNYYFKLVKFEILKKSEEILIASSFIKNNKKKKKIWRLSMFWPPNACKTSAAPIDRISLGEFFWNTSTFEDFLHF